MRKGYLNTDKNVYQHNEKSVPEQLKSMFNCTIKNYVGYAMWKDYT